MRGSGKTSSQYLPHFNSNENCNCKVDSKQSITRINWAITVFKRRVNPWFAGGGDVASLLPLPACGFATPKPQWRPARTGRRGEQRTGHDGVNLPSKLPHWRSTEEKPEKEVQFLPAALPHRKMILPSRSYLTMATSLRQQLRCATGPRTRHRPTDETSTTTSTPPLLVPTTVAHRRRRSTRADKAFLQQENNDPGSSAPHARPLRQTNGRVDASTRHHRTSDFSGRPRPPAKLFVARPHGGVFQAVNGVHTALGVRDDDLASLVSTPRTGEGESPPSVGQPVGRPKEDKRTLRSQDGGSRLKSDLSIYFPNYDDVITDAPRNSGRLMSLEVL